MHIKLDKLSKLYCIHYTSLLKLTMIRKGEIVHFHSPEQHKIYIKYFLADYKEKYVLRKTVCSAIKLKHKKKLTAQYVCNKHNKNICNALALFIDLIFFYCFLMQKAFDTILVEKKRENKEKSRWRIDF